MATCPSCGTPLKEEYGMSQCTACGAFSFIDLEGVAMISEAEEPFSAGFIDRDPNAADTDHLREPLLETPASDARSENSQAHHEPANDFESFDAFAPAPEMPESIDVPVSPESSAPELVNAEFQSFEIGSPARASERESTSEHAFGPADDPLGINEFANSEASSAKDGPLLFRVLISGIDTKEIRESIREVIEDSRFAWDSNEIFSKVVKGHLAIDALSPVKASILITRIKHLPVSIRWEQYAITQGPPG